jgi:predicted transposase YbfD/YdcC
VSPEVEFKSIYIKISEFLRENGATVKVEKISTKVVSKLLCVFDGVSDPRKTGMIIYPLNQLLLCIFFATLSGGETYQDVSFFWETHARLYKRLFKKETIPSHDTFRRILSIIPSDMVNSVMTEVLASYHKNLTKVLNIQSERTLYAVDGKELRGSGRKYETDEKIKNLQILNVYNQNDETCIYSIPIEEKKNEIPHAREILSIMNLKDSIVTFDALHTQWETTNIITRAKGDYVGGLKGNQGVLKEFASDIFDDEEIFSSLKNNPLMSLTYSEITHNQLEERVFYYYALTKRQKMDEFKKWEKVQAIVCYDKTVTHNISGKVGFERRFYLTSLKDLPTAAYCIRKHWGIENNLHNLLDKVCREDDCHVIDRQAATNLSIVKKTCLSLYKLYKGVTDKKISIRTTRKVFGWAFNDSLAKILAFSDEGTLRKALIIEKK